MTLRCLRSPTSAWTVPPAPPSGQDIDAPVLAIEMPTPVPKSGGPLAHATVAVQGSHNRTAPGCRNLTIPRASS